MKKTPHGIAIEAALAADWTKAHEIVQELNDPLACWIHAILHKMEGDAEQPLLVQQSREPSVRGLCDPLAELEPHAHPRRDRQLNEIAWTRDGPQGNGLVLPPHGVR